MSTELDDLNRQCAEALGWKWESHDIVAYEDSDAWKGLFFHTGPYSTVTFSPTTIPAQAMALLGKGDFQLEVRQQGQKPVCRWYHWKKPQGWVSVHDDTPCIAITRAFIAWKAA